MASTLSANSGGGGETQNAAFVLDVSHTISAKWAKQSGGTAGGTEINNLVVQGGGWPAALAPTLNAAFAEKQGLEDQHINGGAGMFVLDQVFAIQNPTLDKAQNGLGVSAGAMYTLESSRPHGVAYPLDLRNAGRDPEKYDPQAVAGNILRPRRLTPTECERLQGFPDGYTNIPWKKGMSPDGPRYKALGNSMAVPVMRWIGKRIQLTEDL